MKNLKFSSLFTLLLIVAASLLVTACSSGFIFNPKDDGATVTIVLKEDDINNMLSNDENHSEDELLDDITSVDMNDGFVRVSGSKTQANGSQVSGSYDISMSSLDGSLQVQIIAVDIPGMSLDDARVTRLNRNLLRDLQEHTDEAGDNLRYSEVSVTDEGITMVLDIDWNH